MAFDRIRDLFDLPERVVKNDFVVRLHEGIQNADATVKNYVVTPRLVKAFDAVLALIGRALDTHTSQGAYLHGSFGSGKSHFMAVLDLLLADRRVAWEKPELHGLRSKHAWIGRKKLLLLPVYCVNATTLEQRIFEDYLDYVRDHHPGASPPAIFRDRVLFEQARAGLAHQGDDVFFRILNKATAAKTGLGRLAAEKAGAWTRERFDRVVVSSDPGERKRLFDALVATHYPAFLGQAGHFVEFGEGLAALSAHAKDLGYDTLLLLLDEVILWLSGIRADEMRLATECQKVTLLVETGKHARPVPIVSLLARQRGLRELLGESALGSTWAAIDEQLAYWKERFDEVRLEDRDFPIILQKRVLTPKSDEAKRAIDKAFETVRRNVPPPDWDRLRGDFTEDDFRAVYPFSPALVQALIALSNTLQRERTAMRIVTDLLVNHVGDLPVGDVIPLGDLYDVLALEQSRDQVVDQRFENARRVYRGQLLPTIQKKHETTTATRCQRLREGHVVEIGCSLCPEAKCRADNRIAKTLILAALTPEVAAVAKLDASKVAQLNHGVIRSPLPGGEASRILGIVRDWATVASIALGTGDNPTISLQLDAVDIEPLLDKAGSVDTYGARQGLVRRLLLEQLGLEATDPVFEHVVEWRGTRRRGQIQFGNVRTIALNALEVPAGCDWQVVIDFPFDEREFSPQDDLRKVEEFCATRAGGAWTMVWLPSFFSTAVNDILGKLVRVAHIDDKPDEYLRLLGSGTERERARGQIGERRRNLTAKVVAALEVAYGIRAADLTLVDPTLSIETHTHPLHANARAATFAKLTLKAAIEEQADALLAVRFSGHPRFRALLTPAKAAKTADVIGRLIEHPAHRVHIVERTEVALLGDIAEPFRLVRLSNDGIAVLETDVLEKIRRSALKEGVTEPQVENIREWAEAEGLGGLDPIARDLLVDAYARYTTATVHDDARPIESIAYGKLPGTATLRHVALPTAEEWGKAIEQASHLWGTGLAGRAVSPKNVDDLDAEAQARLARWTRVDALVPVLERAWKTWGGAGGAKPAAGGGEPARLRTARCAVELARALAGVRGRDLVAELAQARLETSADAVRASIEAAGSLISELERPDAFSNFTLAEARAERDKWAKDVLVDLADALAADELVRPLARTLAELRARIATELSRETRDRDVRVPDQHRGDVLGDRVDGRGGTEHKKSDVRDPIGPQHLTVGPTDFQARIAELRQAWQEALRAGRVLEITWEVRDA